MTPQAKKSCWYVLALMFFLGALRLASKERSVIAPMAVRLVDVAKEAGVSLLNICGGQSKDYIVEVNGNGAAFFDYNNDGYMDILIVNGSTLENMKHGGDQMLCLYRNNGEGTFTDVTAQSGLTKKGWGMGVCVADYDNDGYDDVYITDYGPNVLFHNNGNGTFSDVTQKAGVGDPHWSTGCAFGDYDRDGFVDLYVANYLTFDEKTVPKRGSSQFCQYMGIDVMCGPRGLPGEPDTLYHNNGDGTFTDVTQRAGIRDPGYYGFGVIFSDLDDDGWPDIYVANDSTPHFLFHNNHDGTFTEMALFAGVSLSGEGREQSGMGVDAGDYNNSGHFSIFVTNFSHDYNTLYLNNGDGTFNDVSYPAGLAEPSLPYLGWGTGFVDLDNDGLLDIFIANGHVYPEIDRFAIGTKFLERKQLFQNLGNGRFRDVTDEVGGSLLTEKSSRGVAFGDYDNDGDIDILITNLNGRPQLLRNDGGNRNHWVTVKLVGTKSNRDAIGARISLEAGGRRQTAEVRGDGSYLSHNDLRVHFGLGDSAMVDRLEIRWPSGLAQTLERIAGDHFVEVIEGHQPTTLHTHSLFHR